MLERSDNLNVINKNTVQVSTSEELKQVLENDNEYNYIYLGNDITLESSININPLKEKITIDGTYMNIRYKLTGINSSTSSDTIVVNKNNKEIKVKNIDIEYTNIYGVIYVPSDTNYAGIVVEYNNINFNGTQLSFNPYGTTKIIDSVVTIENINNTSSQEVCESDKVILGGNTTITSNSKESSLFYLRHNTASPTIIILCKSHINLTSETMSLMNGTNKANFTILHDSEVNLITGNGFSASSTHGVNNVLIEERSTLNFIENNHKRIPMWSIFGSLTVKEDAKLYVINSYASTPSDNYNLHFKGNSPSLILDNPKEVVIYTKNANVIYTNNPLTYKIKCKRINMWTDSLDLASAGGINNIPDYYWYKNDDLIQIEGTLTSTTTSITKHNLTNEELQDLSDINYFSFQTKKQFSIGNITTNIHQINSTRNKISGHTLEFCDILIKYNNLENIVSADSDGYFEFDLDSNIDDNTTVEFIINIPGSFIYETRKVLTPHNGEICLMDSDLNFSFLLEPISNNPTILPKNKELLIKVVDSRLISSNWKLYAYINSPLTSQMGFVLNDAIIFKNFDDENIILSEIPKLVYTGTDNGGNAVKSTLTYSKEKGPLLDLSNNALEINEEYFAKIYFQIEE